MRQFEPFFTGTHRFEFDVRGCQPDPVLRPARARGRDAPSEPHLAEGGVRSWWQVTWDVSDTALFPNPADDPDVGDFFARLPADTYLPTWHAQRGGGALARTSYGSHANRGPCGNARRGPYGQPRPHFLTIAHNRCERSDLTAQRNPFRRVLNARGV